MNLYTDGRELHVIVMMTPFIKFEFNLNFYRRMFPILKSRVEGLDPQKKYFIILDIVPLDDARYKFCNGQWAVSGRAEPHYPSRLFVHPDSPATGRHWMDEGLISFHRVKLTNNTKDQSGNVSTY